MLEPGPVGLTTNTIDLIKRIPIRMWKRKIASVWAWSFCCVTITQTLTPTCGVAVLLWCHGSGVDLLQLAVEPLQLATRRLQLDIYISCTLAVSDCPSHPFSCLLDLQLLLDLLPQKHAGILQTLLKHWIQDVAFLQILWERESSQRSWTGTSRSM